MDSIKAKPNAQIKQNYMFGLGVTEIVIIVIVLGIVFFGGKKITGLAKSAGRFTGEFKKGKVEIENELKNVKEEFKNSEMQARGEEKE